MNLSIQNEVSTRNDLIAQGYCFIKGESYIIRNNFKSALQLLVKSWNNLPLDKDLINVDRKTTKNHIYRYRRFCRFKYLLNKEEIIPLPHSPFFQSKKYNLAAGGFERHFAPVEPEIISNNFLLALLKFNHSILPKEGERNEWTIYVHQIRVIGQDRIEGKPTPEGIHQDDVEFFAVHAMNIQNCKGGEAHIYDLFKNPIDTIRISNFMDTYYVNDKQVMHSVTPISPEFSNENAYRDVLIISYLH